MDAGGGVSAGCLYFRFEAECGTLRSIMEKPMNGISLLYGCCKRHEREELLECAVYSPP